MNVECSLTTSLIAFVFLLLIQWVNESVYFFYFLNAKRINGLLNYKSLFVGMHWSSGIELGSKQFISNFHRILQRRGRNFSSKLRSNKSFFVGNPMVSNAYEKHWSKAFLTIREPLGEPLRECRSEENDPLYYSTLIKMCLEIVDVFRSANANLRLVLALVILKYCKNSLHFSNFLWHRMFFFSAATMWTIVYQNFTICVIEFCLRSTEFCVFKSTKKNNNPWSQIRCFIHQH